MIGNQKDLLVNEDLMILDGDFIIGESQLQEVEIILTLSQGELKQDPLLGANLMSYQNSSKSSQEIKSNVSIALQRDGKDYNKIKKELEIHVDKR